MAIGLGYALDGVRRGTERRRAIDIEDESIELAKEDRLRRIRNEDEDRSIAIPVRKSNAETQIGDNEARKQLRPGEVDNAMKGQRLESGEIDYRLENQGEDQALITNKRELESETVAANRKALPGQSELNEKQTNLAINQADLDASTQKSSHMRREQIEQMKAETMQMEQEVARIVQGARTAEAQTALAQTQHKIYGNIYNMAKSDPATAAQMVNDVKSNGINNAASVVFEDGKMRIVDAEGNTLEDPQRGPAEFEIEAMEAAFGSPGAEKGTFKIQDGIIFDTRNGNFSPITDENGQPIKDGDTAKFERYIQNDIWTRSGDAFGSKLGSDYSFEGANAKYATEAQTRAFKYYKENNDGDLTTAWQRAYDEVSAQKARDEFGDDISVISDSGDLDHLGVAENLAPLFAETDADPTEIFKFMGEHGVEDFSDKAQVLKNLQFGVRMSENGLVVTDYNGNRVQIKKGE